MNRQYHFEISRGVGPPCLVSSVASVLGGFSEIRTPILEHKNLFVRSTGETSEIVEKQMFELERSGEVLVLRPEGTPGHAAASPGLPSNPCLAWANAAEAMATEAAAPATIPAIPVSSVEL